MREEEKVLAPVLGSRWTVKREPLQGTSKYDISAVASMAPMMFLLAVWLSARTLLVHSFCDLTACNCMQLQLDCSADLVSNKFCS